MKLKSHSTYVPNIFVPSRKNEYLCRRKNRNAETTINVIAGVRARIALDSYWRKTFRMLMASLICTIKIISRWLSAWNKLEEVKFSSFGFRLQAVWAYSLSAANLLSFSIIWMVSSSVSAPMSSETTATTSIIKKNYVISAESRHFICALIRLRLACVMPK